MLFGAGGTILLYMAARASIPPRPVPPPIEDQDLVTTVEELPTVASSGMAAPGQAEITAPQLHQRSHEPTPSTWKDMPEKQKVDFLRRNYGAQATSDAALPTSRPPPLPPAAATEDRHLRPPFNTGPVKEATNPEWKAMAEEKKREAKA